MAEAKVKLSKVPRHVAIVVDGNRRWAREKGLPDIAGHKKAVDNLEPLIGRAAEHGVEAITFWAWSTENWKRNREFVDDIMSLFREVLRRKKTWQRLLEKGGEMRILGELSRFPADIVNQINQHLKQKPKKRQIWVNIALNYGGRDEIIRAFKEIVARGHRPEEITAELISQHLDTAGQPDVDLMIRTGGEKRTSGYLIWQSAYAEFYFTDTYMPDFTPEQFDQALLEFSQRNRRFGGDTNQ